MIPLSMPGSKPEFVGRRLHDLGHHLGDVGGRVRLAIADAVKATVADIARDAIDRLLARLGHSPAVPRWHQQPRREYDPWDDQDQDEWREQEEDDDLAPSVHAKTAPADRCAVALALTAAGWWLRRQGTLLGALVVALVAAVAAAFTRQLAWGGMPLVEAVGELLNLQRCLAAFATLLARA